jgi:hypothetical protein
VADRSSSGKARRRADQALLATYHEARLADLLEHVRAGFAAYDAGRIDAFGLDDVIDRYRRAARALWSFCAVSGTPGSAGRSRTGGGWPSVRTDDDTRPIG